MKNSGKVFDIVYAKSVQKDVKNIPKHHLKRIKRAIENLKYFPDVSNIRHLTAHLLADFRLRIGEYRILFDIDFSKKRIIILKIGHRKDVY